MSTPIYAVTAAQVRVVDQPVRYAGGLPVAYRCANCQSWHPYADAKIYDPAARAYHGADCMGVDSPDGRAYANAHPPGVRPAAPCVECGTTGGYVVAGHLTPLRTKGRCHACYGRSRYHAA